MRLEDFPRPKDDNRRGVHWSASIYHPTGSALDFWLKELQAMHIKWVKLLDDGGGSSTEVCQRLIAADIMPIVRLWRGEPNPGHIGGREEDTIRRLVAVGVRYFETNNEPDLPAEWKGNWMPSNWLDIVIDNFIIDADRVLGLGGLPALPAMGVGSRDNPVALVVAKGRGDLFEKGAWVAIHNYTLNHPLDYPFDSVNQKGTPVSQEEYDRLAPWGWEGRPREMINEWRAADKNPGDTLIEDASCFLAFHLMDQMIVKTLGHPVPIISTEGGPVVGWKEDRRYPRIDPFLHAASVVAINDFMQGGRDIHGIRCPDSYFSMCHWLLANYRLGFLAPGWESQSWYTDWWNGEFNLKGELPVVAAVKAMPNRPRVKGGSAVLTGRLIRADNGEPLTGLEVKLTAGEREFATAVTDSEGRFRLERLAPGNYDMTVIPWGVVRRSISVTTGATPILEIRLSGGRTSTLSGLVLSHEGEPQTGARVALRRGGVTVGEGVTDAEGEFRFSGLPLGSYQLRVPGITISGIALDGWGGKHLKLTAGTPSGYRYVVSKQRLLPQEETAGRRIFYGTVTDAAGEPLNEVKIEMSWHNAEPGTRFPVKSSGHDPFRPAGYYEFVHTPGVFRLNVVEGDWPSDVADNLDTANVSGRHGQPISYEVSFQLQTVGSATQVDGMVPGAPQGALVKLVGPDGTAETRLAADATFVFDDLAPGSYRVEMPGVGLLADDIVLGPGALYRIMYPLRSKLAGKVVNGHEGLVAVLFAAAPMNWTRQAPLDAAGRFTFDKLPPGRYRLEVGDAVVGDLEMTGENSLTLSPIDFTQGRKSVLQGRVADKTGKPQAKVMVVLRREKGVVANMPTDAQGGYRFVNLPAGVYSLEVVGMGEATSGIRLDGQNEQTRNIVWQPAAPRGVIQGRVVGSAGVPQQGLTARLLLGGAEVAATDSDRSGVFRFAALPPGEYTLRVGDGNPIMAPVHLHDGATVTLELDLTDQKKSLDSYVLFGALPTPETSPDERSLMEARLPVLLDFVGRTGGTGGFSVAEATQAQRVYMVSGSQSDAIEARLRAAGCEVVRLPEDPAALAEELSRRI
jgi:protocatechuate 3,4-dioxygenase beta subunit